MGIRIGTTFTGTVDRVGEQSIQTKFFMIGVPLIPMESFFVLEDRGNGINGIAIPLSGKSVGMAYLRWGSFVATVIAAIGAFTTHSWHRTAADWVPTGIFAAACVAFCFFLGGLSKRERARRSVLRAVTGIAAPPSLLPGHVASDMLARLEQDPARGSDAALDFAIALYRSCVHSDPVAPEQAEAAWARIESSSASVVWA